MATNCADSAATMVSSSLPQRPGAPGYCQPRCTPSCPYIMYRDILSRLVANLSLLDEAGVMLPKTGCVAVIVRKGSTAQANKELQLGVE